MAEAVDAPLVRAPFEALKRATRERKYVVDEVDALAARLRAAAAAPPPAAAALALLVDAASALKGLKRKLDAAAVAERADGARLAARLAHLAALGAPPRGGHVEWSRRRLDRLLVDHMLRGGRLGAAAALARAAGVEALVDSHVFAGAAEVLAALACRDAGPALDWCAAHAARLRKARSPLEFRLRAQQFAELLRAGDAAGALAHARAHLAPWAGAPAVPAAELYRVAALLAFGPGTAVERYAALYDADARWGELAELFRAELLRLHALPRASPLEAHLQAGLCALKAPDGAGAGGGGGVAPVAAARAGPRARADPLQLPTFQRLAAGLPSAKRTLSRLVCALSGEVMSEHNPPMVLPGGDVYSEAALRALAAANGGELRCPRTGAAVPWATVRRAFVS
jgi:macrophage erythroblast attacher